MLKNQKNVNIQGVQKQIKGAPKKERNPIFVKERTWCFFYSRGYCRNGNRCNYLHEEKSEIICKYFLKGICWFKSKCHYYHNKLEQTNYGSPFENNKKLHYKGQFSLFKQVQRLTNEVKQLKDVVRNLSNEAKGVSLKLDDPKISPVSNQNAGQAFGRSEILENPAENCVEKQTQAQQVQQQQLMIEQNQKHQQQQEQKLMMQKSKKTDPAENFVEKQVPIQQLQQQQMTEQQQEQLHQPWQQLMIQQHQQHMLMQKAKKTETIRRGQIDSKRRTVNVGKTSFQRATVEHYNHNIKVAPKECQNTTINKMENDQPICMEKSLEDETQIKLMERDGNKKKIFPSFNEILKRHFSINK